MSDDIVWSDELGDLRKKKKGKSDEGVDENNVIIHIRRLTTGKGRTIIELSELPANKSWCKKLAKDLKKALGVGGAYKNDYIEVHGEKLDDVKNKLDFMKLKWKQIGG